MTKLDVLPSLATAKEMATKLRAERSAAGAPLPHSKALELIAHQHGYRDWNAFRAALAERPRLCPVTPGQRVRGRYLGQPFEGAVLKAAPTESDGFYRVVFRFDAPVDVVRFDSFSAMRQQVACMLDVDGRTAERTSDGAPQLELIPRA